ncbi:MAG: potassium transporter TrkH [Lachnospiraceae bacterium]|nr:potassium transporter TrkH [Lachnospiraceae bacterium]
MKQNRMSPIRLIPFSFLAAILIGALLLMLPISTADGEVTDPMTALFTSTTSVCVTGLVVVDTYSHWSFFGQLVILVLIQTGGLGVITVVSLLMLAGKKKLYLGDRMLLSDALNIDKKKGLLSFVRRIFRGVLIVEGIGAFLFALEFVPRLGLWKGIWASVFQSVSAFCNAGMDVVGPDSMISLRGSPLIMGVTMALIVLGGLGFVVWFDLIDTLKRGFRRIRLSEHTKLVLILTGLLILGGTLFILASEFNNPATIGNMDLPHKIENSLFQSITFRTAGFASVPQDKLNDLTCMGGTVLMFIGGSPVGTAGGVKTVTAFLFLLNALSYITRRKENVIFGKAVSGELMRKSAAIFFFSMISIFIMTGLLIAAEGLSQTDAFYEVVSALGTVGLSRGITPTLGFVGQLVIIVSMYFGRIGPISIAILVARERGTDNSITHAKGKFYVG